ncbi:MAG: nitroreductase family protein [Caldisericia bacterium]|jgi:nitroreductase|nr:nitroreductase family protein [Caldisericia bacterium]
MGDILEIIKTRRSIRHYKKEKIKEDEILKILEAGRWAPSASNNQPWRFIVIYDENQIKKIGEVAKILTINNFVASAPLIIVIYTERKHRWVDLDCGMCAENMMLEAHSLGIGSCFIGAFRENKLKQILNLPKDFYIVGLITFGYPEGEIKAKERIELSQLVKYNYYSKENFKPKLNFKNIFLNIIGKFFKSK